MEQELATGVVQATEVGVVNESRLGKLGFTMAAKNVKTARETSRKLMLAYENHRFVRQEKITEFSKRLRANTLTRDGSYKILSFTPVADYPQVPPPDVLEAMETAVERKCFDAFEVAYIREVADPILFGRVNGCPDRFFIAQWDHDVSISDLIGPNEG